MFQWQHYSNDNKHYSSIYYIDIQFNNVIILNTFIFTILKLSICFFFTFTFNFFVTINLIQKPNFLFHPLSLSLSSSLEHWLIILSVFLLNFTNSWIRIRFYFILPLRFILRLFLAHVHTSLDQSNLCFYIHTCTYLIMNALSYILLLLVAMSIW